MKRGTCYENYKKAEIINFNHIVDVSVDVLKDNLVFTLEIRGSGFSDECRNWTKIIEKRLLHFGGLARKKEKKESSGAYVSLSDCIRAS